MIIDLTSWEAGYEDGLSGRPFQCTPSLDQLSYSSGCFQAESRAGTKEGHRPSSKRHGGSSRLIII